MTCRTVLLVAISALLVPGRLSSQDWQVRYGLPYFFVSDPDEVSNTWSITVKAKPKEGMTILCSPGQLQSLNLVWWRSGSKLNLLKLLRLGRTAPRGKPRLRLGFTRKVQTEDGEFILRHTVNDPEYLGVGRFRNLPALEF